MNMKYMLTISAGAGLCLMFFSGCASTPQSNFYVLNSQAKDLPKIENSGKASQVVIGFNHIQAPKYLDSPVIVTRSSDYKLKVSEFNRWGEPLKDNFRNTVARNLAVLLQNPKIGNTRLLDPRLVDYVINMNVITMDGVLGEKATLMVQWDVYHRSKHPDIAGTRVTTYTTKIKDSSYEAYVIAQSKLTAEFSVDLARRIAELTNAETDEEASSSSDKTEQPAGLSPDKKNGEKK